MMRIATYIEHEGRLVPIEEFEGPIADPSYIPGSIELLVGCVCLLPRDVPDDVNWFWDLWINALEELVAGKKSHGFYFPDQPIPIALSKTHDGARLNIRVEIGATRREALVDYHAFLSAMFSAASQFLCRIIELVGPESCASYIRSLVLVRGLEAAMGCSHPPPLNGESKP